MGFPIVNFKSNFAFVCQTVIFIFVTEDVSFLISFKVRFGGISHPATFCTERRDKGLSEAVLSTGLCLSLCFLIQPYSMP